MSYDGPFVYDLAFPTGADPDWDAAEAKIDTLTRAAYEEAGYDPDQTLSRALSTLRSRWPLDERRYPGVTVHLHPIDPNVEGSYDELDTAIQELDTLGILDALGALKPEEDA